MGGLYSAGPGEDGGLREVLRGILERLRELERPTGTSLSSLYQQVQQTLANIVNQVNTIATNWMTVNAYTKGQIDNFIANPPGNVSIAGTVQSGGVAAFNAGVSSTDVRARVLTSCYAVQYVDGIGRMGTVPSAAKYKQDISPHQLDPDAIRDVQIVTFRYRAAVEALGDDAPVAVGVIADQIDTIPALQPFVQHDENGEISGVDYGQMVVPLIATVQSLLERVDALEQR